MDIDEKLYLREKPIKPLGLVVGLSVLELSFEDVLLLPIVELFIIPESVVALLLLEILLLLIVLLSEV